MRPDFAQKLREVVVGCGDDSEGLVPAERCDVGHRLGGSIAREECLAVCGAFQCQFLFQRKSKDGEEPLPYCFREMGRDSVVAYLQAVNMKVMREAS